MTTGAHRRTSTVLDAIRGLAALAVFLSHARGLFLVDYQEVAAPNPALKMLYFATGFGHQAVMIFFVLSGYFIASTIARKWSDWSWKVYLTDRLVRLYLVLIPGLLLTAAADATGYRWGSHGIYEGAFPGNTIAYSTLDRGDFKTFALNVGFLQTIHGSTFGSNSPLWSLSNEFWYYMAFPCLLLAVAGKRAWWQRAFYLCIALGIGLLVGTSILEYFVIWLMGAAIRLCPRLWPESSALGKPITVALGVGFLLVLAGSRLNPGWMEWDFAIGAAFALWIYGLLHNDRPESRARVEFLCTRLAGCSFTLYVVHFPLLVLIASFVLNNERWQPDIRSLSALAGITFGLSGIAIALAAITEANTNAVRRRVHRLW